ncbi:MAG: MmcQ/YjbR family DNA-binding protein [Thermomicrobiales bacterium]|nr:MmcQ/YjbR family DNA-binding protein [Thermomicrobiales bacterium]MCO5223102.1 MmcQ/YjbR family DNA-binding protein [Thermomicrobiales bacterium]
MMTESHEMFGALRAFCLELPEAQEVSAWDRPTFRVRNKIFAMPRERDEVRPSIWCKAAPGVQTLLVTGDPETFYAPPYVGPKGWIGIVLDANADLDYVTSLVEESYRLIAPKRLVRQLGGE